MSMKRNTWIVPALLSLVMTACGAPGTAEPRSSPPDTSPNASQPEAAGPAVSESNGFKAEAVSHIRVRLDWSEVSGAQGYQLELGFGDDEFFPLAMFDSTVTSFDHFLAPEATELSYRLSATGADNVRTVTVTTPAAEPKPTNVQVTMEVTGPGGSGVTGGFDPSTFDPSTFDPSTMDLSAFLPEGFDPENPDPSLLVPQPVIVSQVIGSSGGEISVTGGNGVIYSLSVPAGALLEDVLITLSPVENIEGIPFSGGFIAGVTIGPRELEFEIPALLTFDIPDANVLPADSENIAFGYENMGEDFHLEPVARNLEPSALVPGNRTKLSSPEAQVDSVTIYVPVKKTGGRGVTNGSARERQTYVETTPNNTEFGRFRDRVASSTTQAENASLQLDLYNRLKNMRVKHQLGGDISITDLLLAQDMAEAMDRVGEFPFEETLDLLVELTYRLLKDGKPGCASQKEAEVMVLGGRLVQSGGEGFHGELRDRFVKHYGEEGEQLLDQVEKALKECRFVIQIVSKMTRDERNLSAYDLVAETKAWVGIPPGREPFGELRWKSPMGKGVIRLVSGRMNIEYFDFQRNDEDAYVVCKGKNDTLEGSTLGVQFEVIFIPGMAAPAGNWPGGFQLTEYVIAGLQRGGTMDCIDKGDGSHSSGGGYSTAGSGDIWATLFFAVHRDPREIALVVTGSEAGGRWRWQSVGPTSDKILRVPVQEESSFDILRQPQ